MAIKLGGIKTRGNASNKLFKIRGAGGGGNGLVTNGLLMNLDPATYSGSGTSFADSSGNGYNVTFTSAPVWNASGWFEMDGTLYGTISKTTGLPYGTSARTLQSWIKIPTGAQVAWTLAYGSGGTGQGFFSGGSTWLNQYYTGGYADDRSAGTLAYNEWVNITTTFENTTAKLYVNGQLLDTFTVSWDTVENIVRYGCQIHADSDNERTDCPVGQVVLYNRVLSDAEVLQNFNATKSRYGL